MKKKVNLFISVIGICFGLLMSVIYPVEGATVSQYSPNPKIQYEYSDGVTCGTIRYMNQISSGSYFNWNYWPQVGSIGSAYVGPGYECGTASISMAWSYVGINAKPTRLLGSTGVTHYGNVDSGVAITPANFTTAWSNYVNGNGKYSPPVIGNQSGGYVGNGHFMVVIGHISGNTYQILDPNNQNVTSAVINGQSVNYTLYGSNRTEKWDRLWQAYNASAQKPVDDQQPTSCVDRVEGGEGVVKVYGWSFDPDDLGYSVAVDVYIGEGSSTESTRIVANKSRTDVDDVHHCGANHGFDDEISTNLTGNQQVRIYALSNNGSANNNPLIYSGVINISPKPETVNVKFLNRDGTVWKESTVNKGKSVTIDANYPKEDGYYFSGWAMAQDAAEPDFLPGDTKSFTSNCSVYPVTVPFEEATSGEEVNIFNIEDFDDPNYSVETVEHVEEIKTDTSYWSGWSDWSLNQVTSDSKTQVETTTMYRYYYFLCPSCGRHEPFYGKSDCGANIPITAGHVTWSTVPYRNCNPQSFSYTTIKQYTTSLGDGQMWIFSSGNINDSAPGTIDKSGNDLVITTGYRSRNYIEQYDISYKTYVRYRITQTSCIHDFETTELPATCQRPACTQKKCKLCGEIRYVFADELYSEWQEEYPEGISEDFIQTKKQYRIRKKETSKGTDPTREGWETVGSDWEKHGVSSSFEYANFSSGFDKNNDIYKKYKKPLMATYNLEKTKRVAVSDIPTGEYIYYHWCRGEYTGGPINRISKESAQGGCDTFHAFVSNVNPATLTEPSDHDGSRQIGNADVCRDTYWYFNVPINKMTTQDYWLYYHYERWGDFTEWSDEDPTTGSNTNSAPKETRTLYRYVIAEAAEHEWNDPAVTVAPTCTTKGQKTYLCKNCGATKTEEIPMIPHEYSKGICKNCAAHDPDFPNVTTVLTVPSVNAEVGETVTIPVMVSNNAGIAGFTLNIDYDEAVLELKKIARGALLQNSDSGLFVPNEAEKIVHYSNAVDVEGDGVLIDLQFYCKAVSDSTPIGVTLKDNEPSNFVNQNGIALKLQSDSGAMSITKLDPLHGVITVGNADGKPGEEVVLNVDITENPGVAVMNLELDYDKTKLEYIGKEDGTLTGWEVGTNAVWVGNEDYTETGTILKLKFRVADTLEPQQIPVTLKATQEDCYNYEEREVLFDIVSGSVNVINRSKEFDVTVVGKGSNMPEAIVEGEQLKVKYKEPCKVGYYSNTEEIKILKQISESDEYHVYDLSSLENGSKLIVVVKGDLNGDGTVKTVDSTKMSVFLKKLAQPTTVQSFAADINGDGQLRTIDGTLHKAHMLKKKLFAW